MPPQQSSQQLANALNPTPYSINLPSEGETFRDVGNNTGGGVYTISGGKLSGVNTASSVANTDLRLANGTIVKAGQSIGGAPLDAGNSSGITALDPSYRGTLWNTSNTAQPANYNSLKTYNIADINSYLQKYGSLPSQGGTQMMNTTSNQLASSSQAPLATQTTALQNQASGKQAVTLGNGQQVFIDNTGQAYDAQGNQVSNQTIGSSTAGSGATPNAGATGQAPTGSTTTPTPTPSTDNYLQQYLASLTPSSDELSAQSKLNDITSQQATINASRDLGIEGVNEQPIAMPFLSGQAAALTNRAAVQTGALSAQAVPLQQQLALAQAKRQAASDVTKAELDYNKPVSVATGANLVNPMTGQTIAQGQSYADKLGASNVLALSKAYPDAGILPTDDPATAADKASQSQSFQIKNSAQRVTWNPLTGQMEIVQTKGPTVAANAGFSGGGSSSPVLGTPSSSGGAYQAGQLTKLLQSQGKTADDATLNALWQQYGTGGAYSNDTAHNSAIYNAMNGGSQGSSTTGAGSTTAPNDIPPPQNYAQKAFYTNMTSGPLSEKINAQNTALGHLSLALQIGQDLKNFELQPANAGKNFWDSAVGKSDVNNYQQTHVLSADELSAAYGADTGSERTLNAAIGGSNSSPQQILDYAKTASQALTSKIMSNVQQYKTAYGQNASINLNWFVSPANQNNLKQLGIVLKQDSNNVAAYQLQPDGTGKLIQ